MNKKTQAEMDRARTAKVARALIRLKHSLAADEELNDQLPDLLAEYDKALASGDRLQLEAKVNDILTG